MVTGFRLAYGGAQEYYGVIPDLIAYGKALGGGYPIGAFGGRADVIDQVREDRLGEPGYVWVASTLGGNPISTAAARAALGVFREPDCYRRLRDLGRYLRNGMRQVLEEHGEQAQVIDPEVLPRNRSGPAPAGARGRRRRRRTVGRRHRPLRLLNVAVHHGAPVKAVEQATGCSVRRVTTPSTAIGA